MTMGRKQWEGCCPKVALSRAVPAPGWHHDPEKIRFELDQPVVESARSPDRVEKGSN